MAKIFKVKLMVTLIVGHLTYLNGNGLFKTFPTQPRLSYEIIQLSLFKILYRFCKTCRWQCLLTLAINLEFSFNNCSVSFWCDTCMYRQNQEVHHTWCSCVCIVWHKTYLIGKVHFSIFFPVSCKFTLC